jgi:hypothetical protein
VGFSADVNAIEIARKVFRERDKKGEKNKRLRK